LGCFSFSREMIFDTHTHLNVEEFAGREAEEIALAAEMGVTHKFFYI